METLLICMRFVQFTAVMTLFGSSLFPCYALRRNDTDRACRDDVAAFVQKVALYASLAAMASAVAWLGCEAVLMSGDADGYRESGTLLLVLDDTQFGRIWRWRLILLAVLPIFFGWRIISRRKPLIAPMLVSGMVLVASLAGIGHGAMGTGFDAWIHLANQAIHLLAAAVWVGGLLVLFHALRSARRFLFDARQLTHALKRFSAVGFAVVLLILASGGLNSWFLVGSVHALLHTIYGRLLMIKISFFLVMIALALFNRLFVMQRLDHKTDANQSLRLLIRSVAVEQGFAILIVASVSVLGTLPPAFDMPGMAM